MSRIEISMEEFQGMKSRIKNLESALDAVSKDAAIKKEILEQVKALYEDLKSSNLYERIFTWNKVLIPFKKLFKNYEGIQTVKKENKTK